MDGGTEQGAGGRDLPLRSAVAWLASPVTVVAMVVLAVNDHVLKQAHPGPVTGKLSDLAGLVLAPAVLAVVLAALRVPRPRAVAIAATGAGFALVKTWQPATDVANHVWSTTGAWNTSILRDPTDLVALPALAVAGWVAVRAARPRSLRARARLAVGTLVLPLAVLTTAATSCSEVQGVTSVSLVRGDFTGGPAGPETRVQVRDEVLGVDGRWSDLVEDVATSAPEGTSTALGLGRPDPFGSKGFGEHRLDVACSAADPTRCWRLAGDGAAVEAGGRGEPWRQELVLTSAERDEVHEEHDSDCGGPVSTAFVDLAVLDTPDGPVVLVAASAAGLAVRDVDGTWVRHPLGELPLHEPGAQTSVAPGTLRHRDPSPFPPDASDPTPPPVPTPPAAPCPSPTTVRVTPDPRNGPPTDLVGCPP